MEWNGFVCFCLVLLCKHFSISLMYFVIIDIYLYTFDAFTLLTFISWQNVMYIKIPIENKFWSLLSFFVLFCYLKRTKIDSSHLNGYIVSALVGLRDLWPIFSWFIRTSACLPAGMWIRSPKCLTWFCFFNHPIMLVQPISSEMNAFSIQLLFFLSHFMFVFPLNILLNDFIVVVAIRNSRFTLFFPLWWPLCILCKNSNESKPNDLKFYYNLS